MAASFPSTARPDAAVIENRFLVAYPVLAAMLHMPPGNRIVRVQSGRPGKQMEVFFEGVDAYEHGRCVRLIVRANDSGTIIDSWFEDAL